MTETSSHDSTLRTFILLAHHIESGRTAADAARICDADPEWVECLAQHWAFQLMMLLVPFFRIKARPSTTTTKVGRNNAAVDRRPRMAPSHWLLSFRIRCDRVDDAANDVTSSEDGAALADRATAPTARTASRAMIHPLPGQAKRKHADEKIEAVTDRAARAFRNGFFLFLSKKPPERAGSLAPRIYTSEEIRPNVNRHRRKSLKPSRQVGK